MANTKRKTDESFDRFSSDDRAKNAKERGLIDIRPPRKNRKEPATTKTKKR